MCMWMSDLGRKFLTLLHVGLTLIKGIPTYHTKLRNYQSEPILWLNKGCCPFQDRFNLYIYQITLQAVCTQQSLIYYEMSAQHDAYVFVCVYKKYPDLMAM